MTQTILSQAHSQIERYREAAMSLEQGRVVDAIEFAAWLDLALALLDFVQKLDRRHQDQVAVDRTRFDRTTAESIMGLYEMWFAPAELLLEILERFDHAGEPVENADAFRAACRSAPLPGTDPDRLLAAQQRFQYGEGRPLREVRDGLRRRAGR